MPSILGTPKMFMTTKKRSHGDTEGRWSLSDSVQILHRSWLAALALMSAANPSTNIQSNIGTPSGWDSVINTAHISSDSDRGQRTQIKPGMVESYFVTLRATLSMPVWPFSQGSLCFGFGDGAGEDALGYWSWCLGGGGQGVASAASGVGESYELWRIPPAKCVWQGWFRPLESQFGPRSIQAKGTGPGLVIACLRDFYSLPPSLPPT